MKTVARNSIPVIAGLLSFPILWAMACGGSPAASVPSSSAKGPSSGAGSPSASSGSNLSNAPSPSTSSSYSSSRLFPESGAGWLYSFAHGNGLNIAATASTLSFYVSAHNGGFDFPVQYADGSNGCTSFSDSNSDTFCVPNPAGGFQPSTGGYGYDDGHLAVVDTTHHVYYDFWKLVVSAGKPASTEVGRIVSGSLSGNGTPGTTAAGITGLAGDILPGELDCETCLQHALNVVVPGSMNSPELGTQGPAVKTDGSVAGAIFREGAKLAFDPTVNVDSLNCSAAVKAIMHALQQYGGVITDQTGNHGIAFYSSLATDPDLTGIDIIGQHLQIYY